MRIFRKKQTRSTEFPSLVMKVGELYVSRSGSGPSTRVPCPADNPFDKRYKPELIPGDEPVSPSDSAWTFVCSLRRPELEKLCEEFKLLCKSYSPTKCVLRGLLMREAFKKEAESYASWHTVLGPVFTTWWLEATPDAVPWIRAPDSRILTSRMSGRGLISVKSTLPRSEEDDEQE